MNKNEIHDLFPSGWPFRFVPCRVWRTYKGGAEIDRFEGSDDPSDGSFPEDWIGSTVKANNPGRENIIEGYSEICSPVDPDAKIGFKDYLSISGREALGEQHFAIYGSNPGLLVKLLDSVLRLPIQAHPSKETSRKVFGSDFGKTESWYVLGTREIDGERPYVLLGFKEGITKEIWSEYYKNQDVEAMIASLNKIYVNTGDVLFVNHGVPHAIGPGCFLVEVQEPSDLVYRTELISPTGAHLTEEIVTMGIGSSRMMDEFDYDGMSLEDTLHRYRIGKRRLSYGKGWSVDSLLGNNVTDCFSIESLSIDCGVSVPYAPGSFAYAIVEEGSGSLDFNGGSVTIERGQNWFIPADIGEPIWSCCHPEGLKVILCKAPRCR